jgi:pimeloyl-ACP methyl ester carboxylesterase
MGVARDTGSDEDPMQRLGRIGSLLRQLGRRLRHGAARLLRPRRAKAPGAVATRSARNGSVLLAYDVRGRGSPLVLIQGVGVGRWGWEPVVDRLAQHFQVITIDNRGIGKSDSPPGPYSTRLLAQDVLAVLDDAGVQRASVAGTSLGGMIAQELALAHPEWVDKLVLVCTIPGGPLTSPMPAQTASLLARAPFMAAEARVRAFVASTLGPRTLRRRPETAERLAALRLAHPQSDPARRAQSEAGMLFNPVGQHHRITQPTLIVQGTADQVVNPDNASILANLIPDARVELLEEAGHLLYWDEPEQFTRVMTEFLRPERGTAPRLVSLRRIRPQSTGG